MESLSSTFQSMKNSLMKSFSSETPTAIQQIRASTIHGGKRMRRKTMKRRNIKRGSTKSKAYKSRKK